jgi:GNAT superfamily N-acetyltransferase
MEVRRLAAADADAATETIALAFRRDPVWRVALAAPDGSGDHLRPYWREYVEGARRYDTVFTTPAAGTVSVWIPPGGTELSEEQECTVREWAERSLDPGRAAALFELWDRFEANHPREQPHAYLSLLATRPDLAGHGYGQSHLAADLQRWDAAGIPTYLESSNPGNDHRYQRHGFVTVGQFTTVVDQAIVSTMWRPVGG